MDIMKCYKCNGVLERNTELIIHNGKTIPQKILKCAKCGTSVTHIDDYEKTRKQIHPTFMERIKNLFSIGKTDFVELSKGKIL